MGFAPAALRDAGASLKCYWWYYVLLMMIFDAVITSYALRISDLQREHLPAPTALIAAGIAAGVSTALIVGVFWFLLYLRAVRISKPEYRFTPSLIGRLVIYYIVLGLIGVLFEIPGRVVEVGLRQIALGTFLAALGALYASIRFGFTLFAVEFDEHPFRLSWQLSGGAAFVGIASAFVAQTIIVEGLTYLMGFVRLRLALAIATGPGVISASTIGFVVVAFVAALTIMVMIPWVMRMMLAFAEFPIVANDQPGS